MLKSIHIQNFTIIDDVTLKFTTGLTCITGEAGAGKSIILDAMGLIMGDKCNVKHINDGKNKTILEAVFTLKNDYLYDFFFENDIDYDKDCIIRREITPQGKSRCFVNDTPVNLQVVKDMSAYLIDINTQYQKFSLSNNENQLEYLDTFNGDNDILHKYGELYLKYSVLKRYLHELTTRYQNSQLENDYNTFVFKELKTANLTQGEYEELENEVEKFEKIDTIKGILQSSLTALETQEQYNVIAALYKIKSDISQISKYIKDGSSMAQRIESLYVETKDIAGELSAMLEDNDYDEATCRRIYERKDLIDNLLFKHKVKTVDELIAKRDEIGSSLFNNEEIEAEIKKVERDLTVLVGDLQSTAQVLSSQRHTSAERLSEMVTGELRDLEMKAATFRINIDTLDDFTSTGKDKVDFMFSGNVGVSPTSLFDVASGGELSRIMLALKTVISAKHFVPTIIFDEIDNGISGMTASAVAEKLKKLSTNVQVIVITHLPQIAAKAANHFLVEKEFTDDKTLSTIKLLEAQERVKAIATMINGDNLSKEAIENAKSLLRK